MAGLDNIGLRLYTQGAGWQLTRRGPFKHCILSSLEGPPGAACEAGLRQTQYCSHVVNERSECRTGGSGRAHRNKEGRVD